MKEYMMRIMEINEKIKEMAMLLSLSISIPIQASTKKNLVTTIRQTMLLIKLAEAEVIPTLSPKEIYIVGKVLGRLEAMYSLLMKEAIKDV